jgi:Transposase, Mutator family/Phasin protein
LGAAQLIGDPTPSTFWTAFLRKLARRGLRGVKLVISDAHEGIKAAVAKVLNATWQCCRVHFMRNVLVHASRQGRRVISAFVATAFAQEDAEAARTQWRHRSTNTAIQGAQGHGAKVLEFAHLNINAAFEQARNLSSVKSLNEFFALSNDHLRQQFEILSGQAQELAAIAQKMTAATTDSIKAGVQKVV